VGEVLTVDETARGSRPTRTNAKRPRERIGQPSSTSTSGSPTPATGGISLADTSITVQGKSTALVKLGCLGIAACKGKLTSLEILELAPGAESMQTKTVRLVRRRAA
jgi:hypothetical protein